VRGIPEPSRRAHTRDGFPFVVHPERSRTPRISCEGRNLLERSTMAASRGTADHDAAPRFQPPFVSCIRLFCSVVRPPTASSPAVITPRQIVRPIHSTALAYATRKGVVRRAWIWPSSRHGCDAPKSYERHPDTVTLRRWYYTGERLSEGRPRERAREDHSRSKRRPASVAGKRRASEPWGRRSLCVRSRTCAPCPRPGRLPLRSPPHRSRTPGISCERPVCSTLVCFIPLFDRTLL
jgi:hypothetical protein